MKKGALILFFFTGLAIFISSCNKSNFDQEGFPGLRCNPGNIEYISDTAFYQKGNGSVGTTIHGQTAGHDRVILYLQQADTTGSFVLDTTRNTAYYLDGVNTWQSVNGSVAITQYYNDSLHVCTGSFGFVARKTTDHNQTMNVSYGFFNNIPRH